MWHDSVVRQSYGGDYFAVQKSIKSTTIHHQLTQYCISIIIKQKEKSLNPSSLRLPCMVFLGSSGWDKKNFRIVLNGTERGTLVVWGLFQENPLNSPEATAGNRILNPTRVGSHTGTPSPAGKHRYPCSQHCQPWCWTTDPVTRSVLCCSWCLADTLPPLPHVPRAPKAFSAVPVSLWHHVLRKSPACGNPPGGASDSFYLQEYLGSKVFSLTEENVYLLPRSSSVKFPSFGKRV